MGIYLIADPHLGHEKVAGIRGFSSSAEHDAWFFRNWEKAVSEGDTVYVLGDLVFGMHKYEVVEQLGSLHGTKYLISGNHDRCHPSMRQAITFEAKMGRYFDGVASSGFLKFKTDSRGFPAPCGRGGIGSCDRLSRHVSLIL